MKKLLAVASLLVVLGGGSEARLAAQSADQPTALNWKAYRTFPATFNGGTKSRASVTVDSTGTIHIAQLVTGISGTYKIIYFNSRYESRGVSGFSDPIELTSVSGTQSVGAPDIWADPFDRIHIVWSHSFPSIIDPINNRPHSNIRHYVAHPNGLTNYEWLTAAADKHFYLEPQIASNQAGNIFVIVKHDSPGPNPFTRAEIGVISGGSLTLFPVSDGVPPSPLFMEKIRFAVRGNTICAVWEDTRPPSPPALKSISYRVGTFDAGIISWPAPRVPITGTTDQDLEPDVDLDQNDTPHFTWRRNISGTPQIMYFGPGGSITQLSTGTGPRQGSSFNGGSRIRIWDNTIHVFYDGFSHTQKYLTAPTWEREQVLEAPNKSAVDAGGVQEVSVFRGRFDLIDPTHHIRSYDTFAEGASWVPAFPGAQVNIVPLNGNLQYRLNLFTTKGVGPSTSLGLTYNTKNAIASFTGASWTMDHLMNITAGGDDESLTLTLPDGLTLNFTFDGTSYNITDKGFGFVAGIQKLGATWKMTCEGGTEYTFDDVGKLNRVRDPKTDNYLEVFYEAGRPSRIVDQLGNGAPGRETTLTYGPSGTPEGNRIVQVKDPDNRTYRLNYSGTYSGAQLTSVVFEGDASQPTYTFEYGVNGLMSKVIPPEGGTLGYEIFYDNAGRVEHIEDPAELYLREDAVDTGEATSQRAKLKLIYNDTAESTTAVIGAGKFCTRVLSRRHPWGLDPLTLPQLNFSTVFVFKADQSFAVSELWDAAALMEVSEIKPIIRTFDVFGNVTSMLDRWGFLTEYTYRDIDGSAPWLTNLLTSVKKPNALLSGNSEVESFTYSSDTFGNVTSHRTKVTPTGTLGQVTRETTYTYIGGKLETTTYPGLTRPDGFPQINVQTTNVYGGPRKQLTQTINAEGNSTRYLAFDNLHGLPKEMTRDGADGTEFTTYNPMGNVTSIQRVQGTGNDPTPATTYLFDGLHRVTTTTDPAGQATTHTYDRESRLTHVLPPAGSVTRTDYDRRGFVKGGETPDGTWSQVVDANGNVRQKKSIRDGWTYIAYDRLDRVIRATLPGTTAYTGPGTGGGGTDMVTLKTYEEFIDANNPRFSLETRVGGAGNRVTRTVYDNRQRPIKVTAPDNMTHRETVYDELDQVVATQLRYGTSVQSATLSYRDARDRIERVRVQDRDYLETVQGFPAWHFSDTYTIFNKMGSVVQTVDPLGDPLSAGYAHKITNTLDVRERLRYVTDGKGVIIRENVWGEDDLLREVWIPNPATKSATPRVKSEARTYTARKEPKTVFNGNGVGLTYTYNAIQGQVNTVTDAQSRVTSTTYYSDTQRIDTVTIASGTGNDVNGFPKSRQTKSVWDKGLLKETLVWNSTPGVNAYNASYKYFYDRGDRLERFDAPLVSPEQHFYNEFGEESQVTIGTKTIIHGYNSLGQRTSSVWSGAYSKTEIRQYSSIGLLEFVSNAALVGGFPAPGSLSKQFFYDNWRGTLATEIFLTGNSTWKIQTHDYDEAKNYKLLVDGQGNSHEWIHDDNNRVEQIKYKNQLVCKAYFTPGGLVDRTSLHNASGLPIAETTHRYDLLGRKTGQETVTLATRQSTADFEWVYDSLDLATTVKVNHLGVRADLQYNERRELTQEAWTGNGSGQSAPLPNPTVFGGASTSNQSLPSNESQGKLQSALSVAAITKAYAYDPAGNRRKLTIGSAVTDYIYNIASRLTDESTPGVSTVVHGYDEWGNENARTTTPSGGSAVVETYVYNYLNLLADYQKPTVHWQYDYWPTGERYAKTNLNNASQNELYVSRFGDVVTEYSTPTALKNSYAQGTGVDSKCTRIPATGDLHRRHFLGDSVGTVSVTLAETGAALETTLKDVWGVPFPNSTSIERYGFAQRELDSESNLVHMRARQYDPRLGRFTQTDPILGNRPTEHYAYAFNNPVGVKDPLGLYGWQVTAPGGQNMTGIDDATRRHLGQRTARFATGVRQGVEGIRDLAVGLGYGAKELVTDPASHWRDMQTVASNAPGAVVQGICETIEEVQRDPGKLDELAGQVVFDAIAGKGASKFKLVPKNSPKLRIDPTPDGASAWDNLASDKLSMGPGAAAITDQSYEIIDGVRRAKAGTMVGNTDIPAQVMVDGKVVETVRVPLDRLHSPHKAVIDVSNPTQMDRWMRTFEKTIQGSEPPPILIRPGGRGPSISDVTIGGQNP